MAPRRDVRHAAWRTAPAVACGRRAWRRTRHLATKAARQSRGQTFLQACAALEPRAAQDRHRSTAQLSGRKGRNSGVDEREARVRLNNRAENSHQPTRERERRMRGFRDPKRTQEFLSYFGPISATLRTEAACDTRLTLSQTTRSPVRCMARIRRTRPKSVDCFLTSP